MVGIVSRAWWCPSKVLFLSTMPPKYLLISASLRVISLKRQKGAIDVTSGDVHQSDWNLP